MPGHAIVQELVTVYGLALVLLLVGGRVRAPAIVSLILTGVIAGPGVLGLVGSDVEVATLSEIGVALLLFMVGLDLPFGELATLWRRAAVGGGAQIVATMALVAPIAALAVGWRIDAILFVGLFVAVSSTSIVVRELTRRNELHSPHGSLALGVLLLQDLAALVALVLAPAAFGSSTVSFGGALLRIVLMAVGLTAATRFVLPVLFRLSSAAGREAFGLMVVVASVGTAWLASTFGLSMTVGAFLAGLVIDESEFSHQIHAEIRPLRDLLTSLFFISIGLLVSPATLAPAIHVVLAAAAGIVVLKTLATLGALRLAGVPLRVAATAALGMAQVGEFSFVLGSQAVANGAIDSASWQVLLGASVLTMMAAPVMLQAAPGFGGWLAGSFESSTPAASPAQVLEGHVVILGFGVGGRLIAAALRAVNTPHVVLELNGAAVQEAVGEGHHILYGDATATEPLRAAGVARAVAVVAVLSDPGATERAVRVVRAINAHVPVLVRTRYRGEARRMSAAGATLAVVEELEASIEIVGQLLVRLDVPGNVAEDLMAEARHTLGAPTVRAVTAPAAPAGEVSSALGEAPVVSQSMVGGDWAVGKTLSGLDLRARTGATILGIRRADTTEAPPPASWAFEVGDVVYLGGAEAAVKRARRHLSEGP